MSIRLPKFFPETVLLSLQLLFLQPSLQGAVCPPGWHQQNGSCILVNASVNVSWCDANRECANLGAELLTNFEALSSLRSIIIYNQQLWVGVADLANESRTQRDGWQFVNGRGVMPEAGADPDGPWHPTDPNREEQDCVMFSYGSGKQGGLMDKFCDGISAGFVCELKPDTPKPTCGFTGSSTGRSRWLPQASRPAGSHTNDEARYCWIELANMMTPRDCAVLAGSRPFARSFFFNGDQSRCRLLEFSDSQISLDVGPNTGWVKYLRV